MPTIQERHQDLIHHLTAYYKTLIALGVFAPTSLILPPPTGHQNIDLPLLQKTNLSTEVLALILHLPYISGPELLNFDHDIAPHTQPVKYIDEDDFEWVRDPMYQGRNDVKSTHLLLSNPGTAGFALIYDTEARKLIAWNPMLEPDEAGYEDQDAVQRPGNGYAHLPLQTPSSLLGHWVQNLVSLDWLPYRGRFIQEPSAEGSTQMWVTVQHEIVSLQRTLKDVYMACGWDTSASDPETAAREFDRGRFLSEKKVWEDKVEGRLKVLEARVERMVEEED